MVRRSSLIVHRSLSIDIGQKGVALILVLWVMTILSMVALELSFAMRTEINVAKNYKEELQGYAMAEGGVQRAIAELIYKHDARLQQIKKTLSLEEGPPEQKEWVADGRPYLLPFEQGSCEIRIMSEAGKININRVSESLLRKIIGQLGLEEEAKDVVVDSILDWRDPNDLYRINGAENDYYLSLKDPYYCKNGNLDSIEELLLIRGVTPELYYGKKETPKGEEEAGYRVGLKDIFSIYAPGEQVDINSATPLVIQTVLDIPREVAQLMVKAREEKAFENQRDLLNRVPELAPFIGKVGRLIVYQSTFPYYTIESRAKWKDGLSVQGLKTIVRIDPREKQRYKTIQWVDRLMDR
ncbi:MAG: general secretion pathway protein GspK [Thermodesulfobacteriota bacterium]